MTINEKGGAPSISASQIGAPLKPKTGEDAPNKTAQEKINEELNDYFFEQKTITINLVKNYSLYRKANDKVLQKKTDYLGSSVHSSRTLSSNKAEVEAYFPNIIGLAVNNENFITRVKQYLNNIQVKIDELGKTFDISFHWNHKKDYYNFKKREDEINAIYDAVPRNDIIKLRDALKTKIHNLNALESEKYKYGHPNNIEDYLIYRHCLLYPDVAKDIAFINSDSNIRFYFKDDQKEAERLRKLRNEVIKAKTNYVATIQDETLFEAVYIQYLVYKGLSVTSGLAEDKVDKEIKLDDFSVKEPKKFNSIFNDPDLKTKAIIEKLINRGELIRASYNQNITTPSGEFIGANLGEAVTWFKNPDNTSQVNAYLVKLKQI